MLKSSGVALQNFVDHIIIGGLEKEEKPAKSIFEKAMRLADCQPDEAIHVGDSLKTDIAGANNAGIRSIWVSHGEELKASLASPDFTVRYTDGNGAYYRQACALIRCD